MLIMKKIFLEIITVFFTLIVLVSCADQNDSITIITTAEKVTEPITEEVVEQTNAPETSAAPDTTEADTTEVFDEYSGEYILNLNSKKIHFPTCQSVSQMKAENKQVSDKNKEELILDGNSPCKICFKNGD